MGDPEPRDWLAETRHHDITFVCERALKAAAGITWQTLGLLAANGARAGHDYYDPTRTIIAEYLRHTGRLDEAAQVEAIGCNEPAPHTGFGLLSATERAALRDALRGA